MPDNYKYVMHPRADKQLSKLPAEVDERVQEKLKEMVENPWRDLSDYDVKQISGTRFNIYRTRIGGYRVLFVKENVDDLVLVGILHVDKREGVYGNTRKLVKRAREFFS